MKKFHIAGVSAVALAAALSSGSASALVLGRTLTVNIADYNAALVAQADATLTVPAGLATYSVGGVGSLEVNSRFTVTLPSGFSFASAPSLTTGGAGEITSTALLSGGIGSQTATFTIGAPAVAGGNSPLGSNGTLTLNQFAVSGATALETPIPVAAALPISVQATNNSQVDDNDLNPLTKPAFGSEPGATAVFVGAIQFIDLTPPVLGTEFGTEPATDSPTAVLSAIAISPELVTPGDVVVPVLQPTGALNTLSTADTATVTISGLFNGIKSAFASADSACTTPSSTGTVAPTQLTIPGVRIDAEVFFCITANGTSLLTQNPLGFNPVVTAGTSTDFLGAGVNNEFPGIWTYFGGGVVNVTNFFTGDDSGYSSLLRVNNAGTGSSTIFAYAQPDTGSVALAGLLGTLTSGIGTIFTEQQIATATGLSLANSGQRATLQLIVTGNFQNVKASSFLVNPSGVVTNVGVQKNVNPS